ncbi:RNA polymerase sigma factor for flagellar operon [Minicystis rosea]|nr:Hypothetical protein A7982_11474 [Minicystis rosea]APR86949.1 RNA polymerase sigma factor for flagellar operon [Minicystis rosea]
MKDVAPPPPPTEREQRLVREAVHVVAECAADVAPRWSRFVSNPEELYAVGTFALYRAARAFRDEMCPSFVLFARCRVRWAMLDNLRLQARRHRIERAAMAASDRFAAEYALAGFDVLDHDQDDIRRHLHEFASRLFAATFAAGIDEVLRGDDREAVELRAEYAHAITSLRKALGALEPREAEVVVLVYGKGKTLQEVSEHVGVAYSTARERHARALDRLHKFLTAFGVTRAPPPIDAPGVPPVLAANDIAPSLGEAGEGGPP